MSRLIDEKIREKLADALLFGALVGGGAVKVGLKDDDVHLTMVPKTKKTPAPAG